MFSDKLIKLVEEIPSTEQKKLREYLTSPFFTTNDDYLRLLDQVLEDLKIQTEGERESTHLSKSEIWKKLFGRAPFDDD